MSNWDTKSAASALTGVETQPINQGGVSKFVTINQIMTYIGSIFEVAGAVAAGIAAHLAAYTHADISHSNRAALDLVSGTNSGDSAGHSGLAPIDNPTFTTGITSPQAVLGDAVHGLYGVYIRLFDSVAPTHPTTVFDTRYAGQASLVTGTGGQSSSLYMDAVKFNISGQWEANIYAGNTVSVDGQIVLNPAGKGTQFMGFIQQPLVKVTTATATFYDDVINIIANYAGVSTYTLPDPTLAPGRILSIKTITANTVVSATSNVVPLAGGAPGTAILPATAGKFCILQSDGSNWNIMQAN